MTDKEALKLALEGAANYIDALGGDSRKYRQALAEQPAPVPGWLLALDAAVSALYFDDSSDFRSGLGAVIRHLDPQIAGEMLAHPKAAYDKVKATDAMTLNA